MTSIQKEVFQALMEQKLEFTPKNFSTVFYTIARKKGLLNDEITKMDKIINSLDKAERDSLPKNVTTYYDLIDILYSRVKKSEVTRFTKHLNTLVTPSIDTTLNLDITKILSSLAKNPYMLTNNLFIEKLILLSKKRVAKDQNVLKEKTEEVKDVADMMFGYFDEALRNNKQTTHSIDEINKKIDSAHNDCLEELKSEFEKVVQNFNTTLEKNKKDLENGQKRCINLKKKVDDLEDDLKKLKKDKDTDFLTDVLNRRGFTIAIENAEKEYIDSAQKYAIFYFDLDFFKKVNDEHGHECGDAVLRTFSKLLKQLTRATDIVGRYGGEEFITLVHYADESELEKYVSRVKTTVTTNSFKYEDLKLKVTFSAGAALRDQYESHEDTLKKADELLYKAKETGRNRICFESGKTI